MGTRVHIGIVELFGGKQNGVDVWESVAEVARQLRWRIDLLQGEIDDHGVLWIHHTFRNVSLVSTPPFWRYIQIPT
jgi:hypothetical protein